MWSSRGILEPDEVRADLLVPFGRRTFPWLGGCRYRFKKRRRVRGRRRGPRPILATSLVKMCNLRIVNRKDNSLDQYLLTSRSRCSPQRDGKYLMQMEWKATHFDCVMSNDGAVTKPRSRPFFSETPVTPQRSAHFDMGPRDPDTPQSGGPQPRRYLQRFRFIVFVFHVDIH